MSTSHGESERAWELFVILAKVAGSMIIVGILAFFAYQLIPVLIPGPMYNMALVEVIIRTAIATLVGGVVLLLALRLVITHSRDFWSWKHPHRMHHGLY